MDIEQIKADIQAKVEEYHQANFAAIYPAGVGIRDWGLQAVAEKVVLPLMEENERLKQQLTAYQNSPTKSKQPA